MGMSEAEAGSFSNESELLVAGAGEALATTCGAHAGTGHLIGT